MTLDIAARVRQSADVSTSPDVLRRLALDPSVTVRASLALNPALPPQVTAMLAADDDERVRLILNRRIAMLTPSMPEAERGRVQQEALANLTALVAQAALRVRASVAEAVRDMPDGPREIVLRLAHDPEVMIAEPVIMFSPMLTREDLVSLIATAPAPATIAVVAQRHGIDEAVSDAVVASNDVRAIGMLLSNHSAQIREATLDALAAQAEEQSTWQEALVRRPRLPVRAQRMLADIVRGSLLEALAARTDLDPKVSRQVSGALEAPPNDLSGDLRPPAALARAMALRDAGRLDDMALLDAMRGSALILATAMFAVRAAVPVSLVDRAFELRNAHMVVALAWRGGLSMQTAVVVQAALARLPPDTIIRGGPNGTYPLAEEEMQRMLTQLGVRETEKRRWMPRRLAR